MATNHYESVAIINATLDEPQIEQAIADVHQLIKTNGGEITDVEDWGRKRLAYSINNAKTGYYLITRFTAPTKAILDFERNLKLDENIIRYMTIALDKEALEYLKNKPKEQPAPSKKNEDENKAEEKKTNQEESKDN